MTIQTTNLKLYSFVVDQIRALAVKLGLTPQTDLTVSLRNIRDERGYPYPRVYYSEDITEIVTSGNPALNARLEFSYEGFSCKFPASELFRIKRELEEIIPRSAHISNRNILA